MALTNEIQSAEPEQRERVGCEDDDASSVTPNTAGIESNAKRMSELPIVTKTTNSGVAARRPSTRVSMRPSS
jgi:hypothetical protein